MGQIVEEVRTVFEMRNDATIYIPNLCNSFKTAK